MMRTLTDSELHAVAGGGTLNAISALGAGLAEGPGSMVSIAAIGLTVTSGTLAFGAIGAALLPFTPPALPSISLP
jgi:hypothetical protein